MVLVLGCSMDSSSRTFILSSEAFEERADFSANLEIFLGRVVFQFLWKGPKVLPPPTQIGEELEPALALPVPFCLQGLAPPPLTSARVFFFTVPCLWLE